MIQQKSVIPENKTRTKKQKTKINYKNVLPYRESISDMVLSVLTRHWIPFHVVTVETSLHKLLLLQIILSWEHSTKCNPARLLPKPLLTIVICFRAQDRRKWIGAQSTKRRMFNASADIQLLYRCRLLLLRSMYHTKRRKKRIDKSRAKVM